MSGLPSTETGDTNTTGALVQGKKVVADSPQADEIVPASATSAQPARLGARLAIGSATCPSAR